jgi:site-specific DNA-cytosine methylase
VGNPFDNPAIISLCPGFLGLERGLIRAIGSVRTLAYVEIESFIVENMVAAMEKGFLAPAPIWTNVKTFDAKPFSGRVAGLLSGYPCQPFSNAGQRGGTEDPRHLYPFISGIIKTARPIWCWFENVDGHISLGYPEVSTDLRSMGYSVEAGIYSAEEVGAPHQRDRLFILAISTEWLDEVKSGNFAGVDQVDTARRWPRRLRDKIAARERYGIAGSGGILNGKELAQPNSERCVHSRKQSFCDIPANGEQSENLAYTSYTGLPGSEWGRTLQYKGTASCGSIAQCSEDKWPAGFGQLQYDWEEPRTIKPSVGSTINGYNFREDLLRAYGNSVVEQTAEVAFLDLIEKHYNNINRSKRET